MLDELIETLGSYAYDPVGFVYWAFPWGEEGTELAKETGPDKWQLEILEALGAGLIDVETAIRLAVSSGHGVGKSALVGWIVWWAFSTFTGTRGVVTANTENQLKTKTWVEIAKWHRLFIARQLFKCTATALFSADEEQAKEWRIDVVPWSERNTEAFAGLHNAGKRIIIVFDEASAIPEIIFETTEGALTDEDTEIIWAIFGNPTRDTGRFRDCFPPSGKFHRRWKTLEVDARTVKRTNKAQINEWIEDYGIDSDFVRVRVLGKFPRQSFSTFISRSTVEAAISRELETPSSGPVILGVDVARFGDDLSVIWPRQGRDARAHTPDVYSGLSTTELTRRIVMKYNELGASAAMIDGGGVGGGVVDQCRALGLNVFEVTFGGKSDGGLVSGERYFNKRAEIYGSLREWLKTGALPDLKAPRSIVDDMCATEFSLSKAKDEIQLEAKDFVKSRLGFSPDLTDALALTFAYPIAENAAFVSRPSSTPDYNPLEHA